MLKEPSAAEKRRLAINTKRREAISAYLANEDVEPKQIETVLQLVDLYGLLHLVHPKRGATARDIHRQAEAAALIQQKKTWRALRGVALQERNSRSEAAAEAARKKVMAQLYQRVRGSAVIPRFPNPEDRRGESTGRRPELEVTRFLQVGARYLKEKCEHAPDHYEECLAGVLLRAEGNLHPLRSQARKMKDKVHTRLMDAPVLDDFDYCIAVGQDPGEEWLPMSLQCRVSTDARQEAGSGGGEERNGG
jgi:hypothetical protein